VTPGQLEFLGVTKMGELSSSRRVGTSRVSDEEFADRGVARTPIAIDPK
jgi:hypothetical protein